jgi:hypothetical protein
MHYDIIKMSSELDYYDKQFLDFLNMEGNEDKKQACLFMFHHHSVYNREKQYFIETFEDVMATLLELTDSETTSEIINNDIRYLDTDEPPTTQSNDINNLNIPENTQTTKDIIEDLFYSPAKCEAYGWFQTVVSNVKITHGLVSLAKLATYGIMKGGCIYYGYSKDYYKGTQPGRVLSKLGSIYVKYTLNNKVDNNILHTNRQEFVPQGFIIKSGSKYTLDLNINKGYNNINVNTKYGYNKNGLTIFNYILNRNNDLILKNFTINKVEKTTSINNPSKYVINNNKVIELNVNLNNPVNKISPDNISYTISACNGNSNVVIDNSNPFKYEGSVELNMNKLNANDNNRVISSNSGNVVINNNTITPTGGTTYSPSTNSNYYHTSENDSDNRGDFDSYSSVNAQCDSLSASGGTNYSPNSNSNYSYSSDSGSSSSGGGEGGCCIQ